jgi:hypothetical protein
LQQLDDNNLAHNRIEKSVACYVTGTAAYKFKRVFLKPKDSIHYLFMIKHVKILLPACPSKNK